MISNNFSVSQQNYQAQLRKDVANSGQNAAAQTVSQGTTGVTKQDKSKETKEMSHLSEAARKAIEQDELKDAQGKGGAENAGKAASKAKAKEREKTKDGGGDLRAGGDRHHHIPSDARPGDQVPTDDGGLVVVGDKASGIGEQKLDKAQAKHLRFLDSEENVKKQTQDLNPAGVAVGKEQTSTREKREKIAKGDFKTNPKCDDEITRVHTEPTHMLDARGKVGSAEIRSAKQEKPTFVEDPFAETIMKEQAKSQLASGNQHEAFVA